ncbi:hypothetical protein [uncultured Roseibium sp.]|uniref:hypothetical protein n=1 Tax=uncultured Roseibium sp. TaxID=1936171 RepID=UPI00261946B4|nr:hypothetical protein [uncultured Roseibium sp.]
MEYWFFYVIVSLFVVVVTAEFYFGTRKHGGIKPYLVNYFRWSLTFMKYWLALVGIWLILASAFVTYAYLSADEHGKAKLEEMFQEITNPRKTLEKNFRKSAQ